MLEMLIDFFFENVQIMKIKNTVEWDSLRISEK